MSVGASLTLQPRTAAVQTTTVRQFLRAAVLAAGTIGIGCIIYLAEKHGLESSSRAVRNPADVMMRVLAMAHFVVGWLYLFSSPRLRNRRAVVRLVLATALGVALCGFFAIFGGTRHPLLAMAFYGYFLFHELGDETMFYQAYGDYACRSPEENRFLKMLAWSATLLLFTVLAACYFGFAWWENSRLLRRMPEGIAPVGLSILGLAAVAFSVRTSWIGLGLYGGVRQMIAAHLPLLFVYGALLAILAVGSLLGTTGLNSIILIHVAVWIMFVHYQLRRQTASPSARRASEGPGNRLRVGLTSAPLKLWSWLRTTPTGFLTLHIGVAVGFLALMALRSHIGHGQGWLGDLLAGRNFCYWGLMHISMSLWKS